MSVTATHFAGTRAVLVELSDLQAVLALAARLDEAPLPGQLDVLAAASTVLVKFDSRSAAKTAASVLSSLTLGSAPANTGKLVEIPVHYDGADLSDVANLTGLSTEAVIAAHTGQLWQAAFGGFAPGFAYLSGENRSLSVPRRETPRTNVPAGAVALAGDYSAIYPRKSPGGWQLIGHSDALLWSLERESPALIRPMDRVRFIPARPSLSLRQDSAAGTAGTPVDASQAPAASAPAVSAPVDATAANPTAANPTSAAGLAIISPGLQSLIQDLGRPGLGGLGVSAAGAVDPSAARAANRLVGNQRGDAVVENLMGSLILQAVTDQVLAITGARVKLTISSPEHPARHPAQNAPLALLAGETLELSPALAGLRCYVGVRGGIVGPLVLGSRSSDVLSGIGPQPLAAGDTLPVGAPNGIHVVGAPEPSTLPELPDDGVAKLRFTAGPRDDWFGPAGLTTLSSQPWQVSTESNRIGVRLELNDGGTALTRIREGELASEGVVWGALQVPPSGLPVLFLADHPVTGGYPVIGVVVPDDLPAAAQLAPGSRVRFVLVDPDTLAPLPTPSTHPARPGDSLAGHQQGSH